MSRLARHATVFLASFFAAAASAQDDPPDKKDKVPDGLKALRDPDPNVRIRAAQILGSLGKTSRFAVPELREALKDKDGRVRVRVAEALWKIEQTSPSILLPVLEAALYDKQVSVRALAPSVIAQLGPKAKAALPSLLVALRDREIDVRIEGLELAPAKDMTDPADAGPEPSPGPAVSTLGDLWLVGRHRILCGNALDTASYAR